MFTVRDTFNHGIISQHRTLQKAKESEAKYARAIKRQGGEPHVTITDRDGDLAADSHPLSCEYWREF